MVKSIYCFFCLIILLFISPSDVFAYRCQMQQDDQYPRMQSIRLPDGRLISLVGHRHPSRNRDRWLANENNLFVPLNIETNIRGYFSHEQLDIIEEKPLEFRYNGFVNNITNRLRDEMPLAEQHYREDYHMLRDLISRNRYEVVGAEFSSTGRYENILTLNEETRNVDGAIQAVNRMVENGVITRAQGDAVLSIYLTPGGYLNETHPELMQNRQVLAMANRRDVTEQQIQEFCSNNHQPPVITTNFPQSSVDALLPRFSNLSQEHQDFIANRVRQNLGEARQRLITLEMRFLGTDVQPVQILNEFISISGLSDLNSEERTQILADLQSYLDSLNGPVCSLRDRREVDRLLESGKSAIYFVGKFHLRPMGQYLEETCRQMRAQINGGTQPPSGQQIEAQGVE